MAAHFNISFSSNHFPGFAPGMELCQHSRGRSREFMARDFLLPSMSNGGIWPASFLACGPLWCTDTSSSWIIFPLISKFQDGRIPHIRSFYNLLTETLNISLCPPQGSGRFNMISKGIHLKGLLMVIH